MNNKCSLCGKSIVYDEAFYCQKCSTVLCKNCSDAHYDMCGSCSSTMIPFQ